MLLHLNLEKCSILPIKKLEQKLYQSLLFTATTLTYLLLLWHRWQGALF